MSDDNGYECGRCGRRPSEAELQSGTCRGCNRAEAAVETKATKPSATFTTHHCGDCLLANGDRLRCNHPQAPVALKQTNGISSNLFDETTPEECPLRKESVVIQLRLPEE